MLAGSDALMASPRVIVSAIGDQGLANNLEKYVTCETLCQEGKEGCRKDVMLFGSETVVLLWRAGDD